MVKLINNANRELLIGEAHALRLLKMPNNGGWKLHKDSGYKFENNELRKNKAKPVRKKKERDDSASLDAREPDTVSRGEQDLG